MALGEQSGHARRPDTVLRERKRWPSCSRVRTAAFGPSSGHRIAESLELARPETAVLCVLLLRGPQTLGEIRGRTGRMHEFASLEETEASLRVLIERTPEALVAKLPRQAGTKEQRYSHLMGETSALRSRPRRTGREIPLFEPEGGEGREARGRGLGHAVRDRRGSRGKLADLKAQLT